MGMGLRLGLGLDATAFTRLVEGDRVRLVRLGLDAILRMGAAPLTRLVAGAGLRLGAAPFTRLVAAEARPVGRRTVRLGTVGRALSMMLLLDPMMLVIVCVIVCEADPELPPLQHWPHSGEEFALPHRQKLTHLPHSQDATRRRFAGKGRVGRIFALLEPPLLSSVPAGPLAERD